MKILSSPDNREKPRREAVQAFKDALGILSNCEATFFVDLDWQNVMPEMMVALPLVETSPFNSLAGAINADESAGIQESLISPNRARDFAAVKADHSSSNEAMAFMASKKSNDVRAGAPGSPEPVHPPVFSLGRNRSATRYTLPPSAAADKQRDMYSTAIAEPPSSAEPSSAESPSSKESLAKQTARRLSTANLTSTASRQVQPNGQTEVGSRYQTINETLEFGASSGGERREEGSRFQTKTEGHIETANHLDEPMKLIAQLVDEIIQKADASVDSPMPDAAPEGAPGFDVRRFAPKTAAPWLPDSGMNERRVEQALPATGALSQIESLAEELTRGLTDAQLPASLVELLPASLVGFSPEKKKTMTGADHQASAAERLAQDLTGLRLGEINSAPPAPNIPTWAQNFVKDPQEGSRPHTLSQMDAETLASLINEVLYEQARRHGVDLS